MNVMTAPAESPADRLDEAHFCLHIGTHKTATTSLQRYFSVNRKPLAKQGVHYISQDIVGAPNHYAHHRIAHAIAGKDDKVSFDMARQFLDAAWEQAAGGMVLISAEAMYRHGIGQDELSNGAHEAYVARVRKLVGERPVQIRVMLRRQDLFAESLYGEHVMSSGYKGGIQAFLTERAPLFNYQERLAIWGDAFGHDNICVATFETPTHKGEIRAFFLNWLGVQSAKGFRDNADQNPSLNQHFVEFKRRLNFPNQTRNANNRLRGWINDLAATPFAAKMGDAGKYYLSPVQRIALLKTYEQSNHAVAKRYLGRETLFASPVEKDIARYEPVPELSEAQFRDMTRHLLRLIAAGDNG